MGFGARLRAVREAQGLKASELASRAHVQGGTLSRWENETRGGDQSRAFDALLKVAEVLGADIHYLLTGKPAPHTRVESAREQAARIALAGGIYEGGVLSVMREELHPGDEQQPVLYWIRIMEARAHEMAAAGDKLGRRVLARTPPKGAEHMPPSSRPAPRNTGVHSKITRQPVEPPHAPEPKRPKR